MLQDTAASSIAMAAPDDRVMPCHECCWLMARSVSVPHVTGGVNVYFVVYTGLLIVGMTWMLYVVPPMQLCRRACREGGGVHAHPPVKSALDTQTCCVCTL